MILDYIDHLELNPEQEETIGNEITSLHDLEKGLWFLYTQVSKIEERVRAQIDPEYEHLIYGRPPGQEWIPLDLITCSFHWYAVSACNYARLVGWLGGRNAKTSIAYVRQVMPHVYIWRNKVAAHFAQIDPKPEDTPADRTASVMRPIAISKGVFVAHPFSVVQGNDESSSVSRNDMEWSLTQTHRSLCDRYWPQQIVGGCVQ